MTYGTSILLIAVGAILDFAVTPTGNTHGFNINKIGLILLIVGIVGLVLSLVFRGPWGGASRRRVVRRRTHVDERGRRLPPEMIVDDETNRF